MSTRPLVVFEGMPGSGGSSGRDRLGRFAKGGSEMIRQVEDANREAARLFQAHVIEQLQGAHWARPNVSTGRLEKATANSQNRYADSAGWGVGDPEYLDKSLAKYWRTIEEGSAATWSRGGMVGMEIYGQWGGSISGYYTNKWGLVPRAAGPWGKGAVDGKLRGVSKKNAKKLKMKPMVVQHEIQPHRYYASAIETFHPTVEWAKTVTGIIRRSAGMSLTNE